MRGTMLAAAMAALLASGGAAEAQQEVRLFAAGSLRAAMTELAAAHGRRGGARVDATFAPSGLLRDRIAGGEAAHLFASANMEHPRALERAGRSGPVLPVARNDLCALLRPGLEVASAALLEAMLSPSTKLATSTPRSDPSGDYAFESFAKAEAVRPGARATLEGKALLLVGAADSIQPPKDRSAYSWHLAEGRADIFLTYCTNGIVARSEVPGIGVVAMPPGLAVGAEYGMTIVAGAPEAARAFHDFILSHEGQDVLATHGFSPVR
jgi:ABC-type molybdate transport system substrate-binding protein